MKRRFWVLLLCGIICVILSACGEKQNPVDSVPGSATMTEKEMQVQESKPKKETEQAFPYQDDGGRTRYRLVINGKEVSTENSPFTYPDDSKCGYYPLKDVLGYMEIACLSSEGESALTTRINGSILKATAGVAEMTYGPKTVKALGKETPVCINGCLYVPSFLFMSVFDNCIVDFSSDRSAATLDTNMSIDLAASGTTGLSLPKAGVPGNVTGNNGSGGTGGAVGSLNCGNCNGSGRSICTFCSGTGSKIEFQQSYDAISKQYKQMQRTVFCSRCGGSGKVACPTCGGSGKR